MSIIVIVIVYWQASTTDVEATVVQAQSQVLSDESVVHDEAAPTATDAPLPSMNVAAQAFDGYAEVNFTSGGDNGSPIYLYTVWADPPLAQNSTGSGTLIPVMGLVDGTSYSFFVMASNKYGESPASAASSAVTPQAAVQGCVTDQLCESGGTVYGFSVRTVAIAAAFAFLLVVGCVCWCFCRARPDSPNSQQAAEDRRQARADSRANSRRNDSKIKVARNEDDYDNDVKLELTPPEPDPAPPSPPVRFEPAASSADLMFVPTVE